MPIDPKIIDQFNLIQQSMLDVRIHRRGHGQGCGLRVPVPQGIGKVAGCGEAVVMADLLRAETYARTRTS